MSKKRKKLPLLENIEITDAGSEGKAIARHNDMVIFVSGAIPGDICDLQIVKKKNKYMEGKPVVFKQLSNLRTKSFCSHYGVCGGCKWQELQYDQQLIFKQKQVQDNFQRLGKFEFPAINNILPSGKTTFYRNKLEFTFSNKKWLTLEEMDEQPQDMNALGFHVPGKFDKIVDIDKCYLQSDLSNDIRNEARRHALENGISFFDLRAQRGTLRNLIIRTSSTNETMVIAVFFENDQGIIKSVLSNLLEKFPSISSLMYVYNPKKNDTIFDLDVHLFAGKDHLIENMEGITFKVGPKSFFQTNSDQAYELYKITRSFANIQNTDTVYDLYTGTGTIANFVANQAKKVIGIEYIPEAIEDAKINSQVNNIDNTAFFAGDMKDLLTEDFMKQHGAADIIITDPPRAGMHEDVTHALLHSNAKKIVYVSCNPATQARDLTILNEKYLVTKVQPVDMFPHTHHVENVVLLELRN